MDVRNSTEPNFTD